MRIHHVRNSPSYCQGRPAGRRGFLPATAAPRAAQSPATESTTPADAAATPTPPATAPTPPIARQPRKAASPNKRRRSKRARALGRSLPPAPRPSAVQRRRPLRYAPPPTTKPKPPTTSAPVNPMANWEESSLKQLVSKLEEDEAAREKQERLDESRQVVGAFDAARGYSSHGDYAAARERIQGAKPRSGRACRLVGGYYNSSRGTQAQSDVAACIDEVHAARAAYETACIKQYNAWRQKMLAEELANHELVVEARKGPGAVNPSLKRGFLTSATSYEKQQQAAETTMQEAYESYRGFLREARVTIARNPDAFPTKITTATTAKPNATTGQSSSRSQGLWARGANLRQQVETLGREEFSFIRTDLDQGLGRANQILKERLQVEVTCNAIRAASRRRPSLATFPWIDS